MQHEHRGCEIERRMATPGKLLAGWLRRAVVLALFCAAVVVRAEMDHLQYSRSLDVKEKDAEFTTRLDVTIHFGTREDDGPRMTVYRGPSDIYGALGKTKTFLRARLECDLVPEEVQEIQRLLDALELQNLPQRDDSSPEAPGDGKYPWAVVAYKDIMRGLRLTPEASLARKLDETIEGFLKKVASNHAPFRFWEPRQKTVAGDDQAAETVTFAQLIDDPIRYHGKRIRVTAYYTSGFEDSSLWPDAEAAWKSEKRLWMGGTSTFANKKLLDRKGLAGKQLVTLEGTFDAGSHGHAGQYYGEIMRVTRCTLAVGATRKTK